MEDTIYEDFYKNLNLAECYEHKVLCSKRRVILVEWMISVCLNYHLQDQTMFLATNYLDRFLSKHLDFEKEKLQLLGITCLWIASKFQEITKMSPHECVYISDNIFKEEDLFQMEEDVLVSLEHRLMTCTPLIYVGENLKQFENSNIESINFPTLKEFTSFFLDMCLLDIKFLKYDRLTLTMTSIYLSLVTTIYNFFLDKKKEIDLSNSTMIDNKIKSGEFCLSDIIETPHSKNPEIDLSILTNNKMRYNEFCLLDMFESPNINNKILKEDKYKFIKELKFCPKCPIEPNLSDLFK